MQLNAQLELLLKLYADSPVDFLRYSIFKLTNLVLKKVKESWHQLASVKKLLSMQFLLYKKGQKV